MTDTRDAATDRSDMDAPARPNQPDSETTLLMLDELQSVISSTDFSRAPIMKRLLSFLVRETAAGRGDQLKAYSVAVDGLGRAPDYDARADSYPRVQVGRLRRMLDAHYRTVPPGNGLRLTIPSGRYRVALQPAHDAGAAPDVAAIPQPPIRPLSFSWQVALLLILLALGAAAVMQLVPMRTVDPAAGRHRPVLELAGSEMANRSDLGNLVRATLLNGLGRSTMYDLRAVRRSGTRDPHAVPARYRLSTDLIGGEKPRLFLRLSRIAPDRLLWSGDIALPADGDGDALDQALAPAIATIGRVDGLIAAHELQENSGNEARGYSCLLLYHRYRKDRDAAELDHVRACVEKSLKADPGDAGLQAAAAQLAIQRMSSSAIDARERATLLQTARRHAQISASIDPLDPWGNAARAKIAVLRNACPQATRYAVRASELQPYDPALLAETGLYMIDCDDPRAEQLIRRAIALDDNPDGRLHAPLLLLAIARDDRTIAREALARMSPPVFGRHGRYYLITAAGYAMIGDIARARAAWSQLRTVNPAIAQDPQGFLERLGYGPDLRARTIGHLRGAGLIGN